MIPASFFIVGFFTGVISVFMVIMRQMGMTLDDIKELHDDDDYESVEIEISDAHVVGVLVVIGILVYWWLK